MALRPTTSTARPKASASVAPSNSNMNTNNMNMNSSSSAPAVAAAKPAPLSWKDAVKNGVAAAPVKPIAASAPRTSPRSKHEHRHHHKHSQLLPHEQKPRQTTCQRAKLLRSRSVSRIVESPTFRKRTDSVQRHPSSASISAAAAPAASSTARQTPLALLVAKSSSSSDCMQRGRTSTVSPPLPRTVNALFASPRKTARAPRELDNAGAPRHRARSASADLVLLRKCELPRRLFESRCVNDAHEVHGSTASNGVRFDSCSASHTDTPRSATLRTRAMSVPDAPERGHRIACTFASFAAAAARSSSDSDSDSSAHTTRSTTPPPPTAARKPSASVGDDELSELDCDDTNSESTAESSCPSPRHSPVAGFSLGLHAPPSSAAAASSAAESASSAYADECDMLSDVLSLEDEQDFEAMMLLDRITDLSAEFVAHREYEDANALAWSVEHAARQGVLAPDVAANLHANIHAGALDEARDVLYHKCHLVPAVGSVIESPGTAATELDPRVAQAFSEYVDALAPTDAPVARLHKLQVLKLLSDIVTTWVKAVGRARGLSDEHVAITSGALFLAGSYRLGLHDPTSDIDAVCVVPYHVTHEDFFSSFAHTLEQTPGVTHLAPVPHAYVPLISLAILGVSMDLLFARLPMMCVDAHQEIDSDHMLVGVHAASMKSLNAPRVSSMLLCLVPKRRVFRVVLRAVRTWARRRGIYSAKLGYLGGISWAILVAFVCQMYPDAAPAKVFVRFFQVMSEWQWPQPVMLNVIYDAGLGFEMWDPRQNVYDRAHIMPIITPAYPHMNSAVQVSQSTFSVLYEEFWRARYLAEAAAAVAVPSPMLLAPSSDASTAPFGIASAGTNALQYTPTDWLPVAAPAVPAPIGSSPQPSIVTVDTAALVRQPWEKLFEPTNFFIRYDTYLVVNYEAGTPSAMHKWGKFVASRLRKLVDSVQHVNLVARVHALPRFFPHTSNGATPGSCMFIGIEFHMRRSTNSSGTSTTNTGTANTGTPNNGTNNTGSTVPVSHLPKDDPEVKSNLEQTIRFFMATDLQQMDDKHASMTAEARLLSWDELPAFVFANGRAVAAVERATYHANLEAMGFAQQTPLAFRPAYYSSSYARGGRWRSNGPRKYNGGGKNKLHRFRDGPRTYPMTQAG